MRPYTEENDIQWVMIDNEKYIQWEWHTIGQYIQWGMTGNSWTGDARQWIMIDNAHYGEWHINGWWQSIVNDKYIMNRGERQWDMTDNGEWQIGVSDNGIWQIMVNDK